MLDKDAVLAVIAKFMYGANQEVDIASTGECFDEKIADAKYQLCKKIKESIDSLEAKEVDLNGEIDKVWDTDYEDFGIPVDDFYRVARHFFELGLKASQKGE